MGNEYRGWRGIGACLLICLFTACSTPDEYGLLIANKVEVEILEQDLALPTEIGMKVQTITVSSETPNDILAPFEGKLKPTSDSSFVLKGDAVFLTLVGNLEILSKEDVTKGQLIAKTTGKDTHLDLQLIKISDNIPVPAEHSEILALFPVY